MAVLGILSFFQITLVPGVVLLAASKYRGSLLRRIFLAFGLSLTANYLAVFGLAAAGVYVRPVVFAVFGAELVVLACLEGAAARRWFFSPLLPATVGPAVAEIRRLRVLSGPGIAGLVKTIAAATALLLVLFQICQTVVTFVANWGTIFTWVDAVLSWNRWAVDWFHNGLPTFTYHYPGLPPVSSPDRPPFFRQLASWRSTND